MTCAGLAATAQQAPGERDRTRDRFNFVPMVCVPIRCFSVGADPEQDVKGSHGDLCHRVVLGGTDGVQVVPLHTAKSESARSTSGTWWSSGLRELGVLGSHRTVRRQNPRSQCLLVQLDLGPEQVARPKLSKCPSSRASLRSEILSGCEAGPSYGSAQDLMPGKTSRFSLSGCATRS